MQRYAKHTRSQGRTRTWHELTGSPHHEDVKIHKARLQTPKLDKHDSLRVPDGNQEMDQECRSGVGDTSPSFLPFQPADVPCHDHTGHHPARTAPALTMARDRHESERKKRGWEHFGLAACTTTCSDTSIFAVLRSRFFFSKVKSLSFLKKKIHPLTTPCLAAKAKGINRGCST